MMMTGRGSAALVRRLTRESELSLPVGGVCVLSLLSVDHMEGLFRSGGKVPALGRHGERPGAAAHHALPAIDAAVLAVAECELLRRPSTTVTLMASAGQSLTQSMHPVHRAASHRSSPRVRSGAGSTTKG